MSSEPLLEREQAEDCRQAEDQRQAHEEQQEGRQGGEQQQDEGEHAQARPSEPLVHLSPSTASEHVYLGGEHLDLSSSGGMLEPGSKHVLPLVKLKGVVLFPGSTLPLIIGAPTNGMNVGVCMDLGAVLDDASPTSKLLVVINHRGHFSPDKHVVGCTAEIRQLRRGNRAGRGTILVGRQRVMVELGEHTYRTGCAPVTVLPSDYIPPVPQAMRAGLTPWPAATAAPYDVAGLAAKLRVLVAQRFPKLAGGAGLPVPPGSQDSAETATAPSDKDVHEPYRFIPAKPPKEPLAFANWLAANMPMASMYRRRLLDAPTAADRLRAEIEHIQNHMDHTLRCGRCTQGLANAHDVFVSTEEGAGAIFCNEYGYVHDSVSFSTLKRGARVRLQQPAQEKHSFYPGYIWWIASCGRCNNHLGWRFKAPKPNMRPREFWGIRRDALTEALPTADMAAIEREVEAAQQGSDAGEGASIEETGDDEDDMIVANPMDVLQHLQAVMNQEGDEEVQHNMPRGALASALLELTNFIRLSQQDTGPGGGAGRGRGRGGGGASVPLMAPMTEDESEGDVELASGQEGGEGGTEDEEDDSESYTTLSGDEGLEPPSGSGREGGEGGQGGG